MNQSRYGSRPPHIGRSIIALSALLTLATACGLFQPAIADLEPSVSGVQVVDAAARQQQTNFQLAASIPGVTPNTSSVQVSFTTAMNQVSVQQSINIYSGSYSEAGNPATFQKLQLTSMCNGQWRVRNPNAQAISFQWDIYNTTEKGVGVAIPSGDTFLQTTTGSNTFRLFVASVSQAVKATNSAACSNSSNLYGFIWTSAQTVQVTPVAALQGGKAYTLAVSTAAKNLSGMRELSAPYSSGFVTLGSEREVGLLQPDSTYTFRNGTTITAPPGAFTGAPIEVYSEKLAPVGSISGAVDDFYAFIGDVYRIGTTGTDIGVDKTTFLITLPIPSGESVSSLAIASLYEENTEYPSAEDGSWIPGSPGKNGLFNGLPYAKTAVLFSIGTRFSLIRFPLTNLFSKQLISQAEQSPSEIFDFSCDDTPCDFQGTTEIKNQLKNAYSY